MRNAVIFACLPPVCAVVVFLVVAPGTTRASNSRIAPEPTLNLAGAVANPGESGEGDESHAIGLDRWATSIPFSSGIERPSAGPGDVETLDRPDSAAFPYWLDTAHFRVHYTDAGEDSLPWPDTAYIDSVAQNLEQSYACLFDTLGLALPVPDGRRGGGTDLIDFYVQHFDPFIIGSFGVDSCFAGGPCERQCMGHCSIRNNLSSKWRRSTAALECFELMEIATNPSADYWIASSMERWAEHAVFGRNSNYRYWMFEWLATPYQTLWTTEEPFRPLGSLLYWVLLEETQGRAFLADFWTRCCGRDWLPVLEEMLHERGTSFDETLVQLALWSNAAGGRSDDRHFEDGLAYAPVQCQAKHTTFPVITASVPEDSLAEPAGSNFIRFFGPGTRDTLRVDFDGDPEMRDQRGVSLVITRGHVHEEQTLAPDADGDVAFVVPDWPSCDYATLIVTNYHEASGDPRFSYSATEVGAGVPSRISDLTFGPNPFRYTTEIAFSASGLAAPASVEIYNARGARVRTIPIDSMGQGTKSVVWNGSNERGLRVPFGCYFVRARYGNAVATGKLVYLF